MKLHIVTAYKATILLLTAMETSKPHSLILSPTSTESSVFLSSRVYHCRRFVLMNLCYALGTLSSARAQQSTSKPKTVLHSAQFLLISCTVKVREVKPYKYRRIYLFCEKRRRLTF